jgi:hypothetical protein
MHISTRNTGSGRRIVRASRYVNALSFGYELYSVNIPTIQVTLDGADGKSYRVSLTDSDITAINAARAKYAEQFDRYKGK